MQTAEKPLLYQRLMDVKPSGWTLNHWATQADVSRNVFQNIATRGRARTDIIEKLLRAAGADAVDFYSVDAATGDVTLYQAKEYKPEKPAFTYQSPEEHDVPMRGTALGGDFEVQLDGAMKFAELTEVDMGDTIDWIRRPTSLARKRDIYAITIVGTSMDPRWDPGDPAYVDPKRPPAIGDDVVVQLKGAEGADADRVVSVLIKRLAKRTTTFVELEQFNPPLVFTVETKAIAAIHRVIPRRELAYG